MTTFTPDANDGFVATSLGAILTVAAATSQYARKTIFNNINAADQTLDIYENISGTDRHLKRVTLKQYWNYEYDFGVLPANAIIKAVTTTSSAVNYENKTIKEA